MNESLWQLVFVAAPLVILVPTAICFQILTRNIIVSALALGDVATFRSELNPLRYLWIVLSNFVVTVLTAFAMHPLGARSGSTATRPNASRSNPRAGWGRSSTPRRARIRRSARSSARSRTSGYRFENTGAPLRARVLRARRRDPGLRTGTVPPAPRRRHRRNRGRGPRGERAARRHPADPHARERAALRALRGAPPGVPGGSGNEDVPVDGLAGAVLAGQGRGPVRGARPRGAGSACRGAGGRGWSGGADSTPGGGLRRPAGVSRARRGHVLVHPASASREERASRPRRRRSRDGPASIRSRRSTFATPGCSAPTPSRSPAVRSWSPTTWCTCSKTTT